MDWQTLVAWSGPALDLAGLAALGAVLLQLRRDPTAAWREYEGRLRALQESLRLLVLQAEGEARELDRRLAAHAEELRALRGEAEPRAEHAGATRSPSRGGSTPRAAAAQPGAAAAQPAAAGAAGAAPSKPGTPAMSLAERVQQLAATRTPIAEIARRLSLPIAEARVLAGLTTGGLTSDGAPEASRRATPAHAAVLARGRNGVGS
jgi:hypothetical protein